MYCMQGFVWSLLIMVVDLGATILAQSHYSIIAPGTISSHWKYSVAVALHQADRPATIRISLHSPTTSMNLAQNVTLRPCESQLIDFMPPQLLKKFNYELRAEGLEGISLNEISPLFVSEQGGPKIFIESDRGIYKPEDTVYFRILILDANLRPLNIVEPIRVQIMDADNNRVKQFKDIKLQHGVFAAKFSLSKQPVLGKWTISVYLSGIYNLYRTLVFQVDKYVLPKFSVHIESNSYFLAGDDSIKATVYAKYTYGKYVPGTAVVYLLDANDRKPESAHKYTIELKNGDIKTDVYLETEALKYAQKVVIVAMFQEYYTNITALTETQLNMEYTHYKIIVPELGIEFLDQKPYRLKAYVEFRNGTIVIDRTQPVFLKLGKNNYAAYLDETGLAQFEFEFEPNADFLISYNDTTEIVSNIYGPSRSNFNEMCTIEMKQFGSSNVNGEILEFEISSPRNIPYLIFTIISHGNIVKQEYLQVAENQNSYTLKLNVTIDLIPQSYLYVHYIDNNELRYCELTIQLPKKFENELSLELPLLVKPGEDINMIVRGQPKSLISIVAVDKSSLLLNSDNLLKPSDIMEDLLYHRTYCPHTGLINYPGCLAGVLTLTNGKFEQYDTSTIQSRKPKDSNSVQKIEETNSADKFKKRSVFPETWIFQDLEIVGSNTTLKLKVPDTITTWIVRAFSVNDQSGFTMLENTQEIQAFQPFFISTNLPYAVKRGEVITIPITVFNYLQQSYVTDVTLDNGREDFIFLDAHNRPDNKISETKTITIPANEGNNVAFVIKPKRVGDIDIRVTAQNDITSDTIIKKLKVEPEGIKKQYNQDESLNMKEGHFKKSTLYAPIPTHIVPDSEYMLLSVGGDILVSTLENLEDLVQKPSGCGEQNMINLAPNILVLDYLKALNKLSNLTQLVSKAKRFIDTGFQQQLTYRHSSGGYSVFGPKDDSTESNWLTAYVTRFLIKGLKYSAIEPCIINDGLEFLAKQQAVNGSFQQRGYLFHPSHQDEYGYTAFVLMAYLEDGKYSRKYASVIERGIQFLTSNLDKINDAYSLAIVANVFQATTNSHVNQVLRNLKQLAHQEDGFMWWSTKTKKNSSTSSVEITSYALMVLLETSGHYGSIFNWLLKQRNSQGGFGSTQDTVVGLQALIKYAEKSPLANTDETQVKLGYVAKNERGEKVKENFLEVNTENQLVLQQEELPSTTRSVDIEIMGQGKIFLQFSYQYYISVDGRKLRREDIPQQRSRMSFDMVNDEHQHFAIKPIAKVSSNSMTLSLGICYTYQPQATDESQTNMVILQVQLPSGYVVNDDHIENLKEEEQISRVDVKNSLTVLEIYFERIEANNEECLTIQAERMYEVVALKPSLIEMADYYNPQLRSEALYEIKTVVN